MGEPDEALRLTEKAGTARALAAAKVWHRFAPCAPGTGWTPVPHRAKRRESSRLAARILFRRLIRGLLIECVNGYDASVVSGACDARLAGCGS